jgi:hypothetical protein
MFIGAYFFICGVFVRGEHNNVIFAGPLRDITLLYL